MSLNKIEDLIEEASIENECYKAFLERGKSLSSLPKNQDKTLLEYRVNTDNPWKIYLFSALCRKRNLQTFRYRRQKYTSINVQVSKEVMENELWPEYSKFAKILDDLIEVAMDVLLKVIHGKEEELL